MISAADVDDAAVRLAGIVEATPLQFCPRLSQVTGYRVYLKREDLQAVRSYKLRGAFNLMSQLSDAERAAGVVCASAGNHAQGVAYASRMLGIETRIYLPRNTPRQKRDRIRVHAGPSAELILVGETYDDAAAAAVTDVERTGATLVPPFDDPRTMAGQGTIAAEILAQCESMLGQAPDAVVLPVGGGGLISGVAAYLAERSPAVRVIGVEPAGAASMSAAIAVGAPTTLPDMDPFVDGAAVRRVGDGPFEVLSSLSKSVRLLVAEEGAICTQMLELYQNEGIIAEPAGALAATGLVDPGLSDSGVDAPAADSVVVVLVSGGNNDVSRYGEIVERSLVHAGRKHYFLVEFPQEPGALRQFLDEVLGPEDDITLFEYVKRNNRDFGPALVGIEIGDAAELPALLARMQASRIESERLEPGSTAYTFLT